MARRNSTKKQAASKMHSEKTDQTIKKTNLPLESLHASCNKVSEPTVNETTNKKSDDYPQTNTKTCERKEDQDTRIRNTDSNTVRWVVKRLKMELTDQQIQKQLQEENLHVNILKAERILTYSELNEMLHTRDWANPASEPLGSNIDYPLNMIVRRC